MQICIVVLAAGHISLGLQMISNSSQQRNKLIGDIGERVARITLEGHNINIAIGPNTKIFDVGNIDRVAFIY